MDVIFKIGMSVLPSMFGFMLFLMLRAGSHRPFCHLRLSRALDRLVSLGLFFELIEMGVHTAEVMTEIPFPLFPKYAAYGGMLILWIKMYAEYVRLTRRFYAILPIALSVPLQLLLMPNVDLFLPSTAVSLAGIFMEVKNEECFIDRLTGLYNQNYLQYLRSDPSALKKTEWMGAMADIDGLKEINDRFGHSAGDQALVDFAGILKEIAPSKAKAIRCSGDEFILLFEPEETGNSRLLDQTINDRLQLFNQTESRPYRLSAAVGICRMDLRSASIDGMLRQLDREMYTEKSKRM